jgi:hypothetical protein
MVLTSDNQFVKPVSGLGDAGKQLGLGVRPRRSRVEMNALDRRDEFAADTRGRLSPSGDDTRFSNDRRNLSCERDLDRAISDRDALDRSRNGRLP